MAGHTSVLCPEVLTVLLFREGKQVDSLPSPAAQAADPALVPGARLGDIIHDLNNLLAAIQGYGALLLEDLKEGSLERSFAGNIVEASEKAKQLVNGMRSARHDPALHAPAADDRSIPDKAEKHRVLVIDDEEAVAQLLARMLAREGFDADWCCDPSEALEKVAQAPAGWHAVVSDHSMPGMEGDELAVRLRSVNPKLAVILCTGNLRSLGGSYNPAVSAVLEKPVSRAQLRDAIQAAMAAAEGG